MEGTADIFCPSVFCAEILTRNLDRKPDLLDSKNCNLISFTFDACAFPVLCSHIHCNFLEMLYHNIYQPWISIVVRLVGVYTSSEVIPRIPCFSSSRKCISKYFAKAFTRSSSVCNVSKISVSPRTLRLTSLPDITHWPMISVPS
jgi:hypothetical protein